MTQLPAAQSLHANRRPAWSVGMLRFEKAAVGEPGRWLRT